MEIKYRFSGEIIGEFDIAPGADLYGANLRGADLREACLRGADLCEAKINWNSHDLVAEILRQAAGDDVAKLKLAGFVLIQREWCWRQFLALNDPLKGWALSVLREYADEDEGALDAVRWEDEGSI